MCVDVLLIFALLLCFCIVQSPPSPPLLVGIPNPIILMSIAFNRVVFGLSTPGIKGIGYFYRGIGYFYRSFLLFVEIVWLSKCTRREREAPGAGRHVRVSTLSSDPGVIPGWGGSPSSPP